MYPPELEKLIEAALLDGELTEKEKQILFKKATSLGIDLDEFEMVLNARLYEKQQSTKKVSDTPPPPKSNKYGEVKKCPSCGAVVESFQTRCSDCGLEFREVQASTSIQELFRLLDEVEKERKENNNPLAAIGKQFAKSFGGGVTDKIINRKIEIIRTFPVPNTKEDILEFISLALPNTKKRSEFVMEPSLQESNALHNALIHAWQSKCEQVLMKAKIAFKNDKANLEEILEYEKLLKKNFKKGNSSRFAWIYTIIALSVAFGLFYGLWNFSHNSIRSESYKTEINKEKSRLEQIVKEINLAVDVKDLNKAEFLTNQLHWEYYNENVSNNEIEKLTEKWDIKREELLSAIKDIKNNNQIRNDK